MITLRKLVTVVSFSAVGTWAEIEFDLHVLFHGEPLPTLSGVLLWFIVDVERLHSITVEAYMVSCSAYICVARRLM